MSAWYVLSSMGIYAVTPGEGSWSVIKPYFEKVKINFENNKSEEINFKNYLEKSEFIDLLKVTHSQVEIYPKLIPVPVFETKSKSFTENLKVEITSQNPSDKIYYWMNGINDSTKDKIWKLYTQPLLINSTIEILAKINNDGKESAIVKANYFKKPNNYTIQIKGRYNSQYNAGGDSGLLDGIYGNENWRKGEWQGYQNQDFEAIIDLQEVKTISEITSNYLQDTRSWILMPTKVDYYISEDNINFRKVGTTENTVDPKNYETVIKQFPIQFKKQKVRYVKVVATNFGKLPSWHQGYPDSGDAFIFIDEIEIK
jgi:hypothetical protein